VSKRTPQHPSSYSDIRPILDAALAAGGGQYRPRGANGQASPQAAIRFRHRAYSFRRALQHQLREQGMGIVEVSTPYDSMVLSIDAQDPTLVIINRPDPLGDLLDLKGNRLEIGGTPPSAQGPDGDPLLEQARQQAKDLGIEL
jgi:hypothetical protein